MLRESYYYKLPVPFLFFIPLFSSKQNDDEFSLKLCFPLGSSKEKFALDFGNKLKLLLASLGQYIRNFLLYLLSLYTAVGRLP